jgi:DNA polymerase III delta prime subunit
MLQEFLWTEIYRPKSVADTILPPALRATFQQFVDQKNIPNLLLSGPPGVGKTTIARAMLEQLGCDYIVINGSLNGNIDTLRNDIQNFASSVSLMGGRKYVILDEADYLNPNSTQPALRNFMEEFSKNCGFILTCNFKNKIIEPLHSRCSVIDFRIQKKEMDKLAAQFYKRTLGILDTEKIKYDNKVVAEVIKKHFPDWRRVLNELQRYSATGAIDSGILSDLQDVSIRQLIQLMKDKKNYSQVRKWVSENLDADQVGLFRKFYDTASEYFTTKSIPMLVLLLGKYQYQAAFCADMEINTMAFLTECMIELEFTNE